MKNRHTFSEEEIKGWNSLIGFACREYARSIGLDRTSRLNLEASYKGNIILLMMHARQKNISCKEYVDQMLRIWMADERGGK